ncbi:MAG: PHP domain-containing protein [Candidatus Theseobacter exili]|nr:PHP domain-containing protein [Candidatus Theseobacter exili]
MKDFKGTRWYKCDLHLHTTASKCFADDKVTAEQWVARAIEQKLDCVAVTDHNTGTGIDEIVKAAADTSLTVFPGVEITCDTSKIHLLILFDVSKTSEDVRDFLTKCDIERENFGNQDAHTSKSIFKVAEIAKKRGCLIIPAHIDEYSGLGKVSHDNLKDFYELEYINALQVVHKEFLSPDLQTKGNKEFLSQLNEYYGNPPTPIDEATLKSWYAPVQKAITENKAILTFSDNPHEPNNSKHGLWGIGSRYTWIKMDENPSLEGLRQAFLLHEFRVKSDFDSEESPYEFPATWIKRITVTDTEVTDDSQPFTVDFSPQLTTIIGGRGSGKSSILRFIRGVFGRTADLKAVGNDSILEDHTIFYQQWQSRKKKGVFKESSLIEVFVVRNDIDYRIAASNIKSSSDQTITIEKWDTDKGAYEIIDDEGFLEFFAFENFSQKQIYEIAQAPNALRERIDNAIPAISKLNATKKELKLEYFVKATTIRKIEQQVSDKGRISTEIKDLSNQIKTYEKSPIVALLKKRQSYAKEKEELTSFLESLQENNTLFDDLIEQFQLDEIDFENVSEEQQPEIKKITDKAAKAFEGIAAEIEALKKKSTGISISFESDLLKSKWQKCYAENLQKIEKEKEVLKEKGIKSIENFEGLIESKNKKTKLLSKIVAQEKELVTELKVKQAIKEKYVAALKDITTSRKEFVKEILEGKKVRISINQFRNKDNYEQRIREILQKESGYTTTIDNMVTKCFTGKVEPNLDKIFQDILSMRAGEVPDGYDGFMKNAIERLNDEQIDEFDLLFPEDEIQVEYKQPKSNAFKPLSNASAGQKTTAILTFLLSYGNTPLILDQPEDDLDNKLVYDLIVERLRQAKEHRQVIVVTHNANIPVNGDAEYIVAMNSESKKIEVLHAGTVEETHITKEICDVMEGSEEAFNMRSKRYDHISS